MEDFANHIIGMVIFWSFLIIGGIFAFTHGIPWLFRTLKEADEEPQPTFGQKANLKLKQYGLYADGRRDGVYLGRPFKEEPEANPPAHVIYSGDRHVITFGPIGSGKATTAQVPALLAASDTSALVIDVKGQLAAVTGQARALSGQTVVAINPFDVLKIPTATYNPLRHLDVNSPSFASDCKKIAEGLGFSGAENSSDKNAFFEITALDLVNLLIQWAVLFAGKSRFEEYEPNLISVRKVLNLGHAERQTFFEALTGGTNAVIAEGAQLFVSERGAIEDCFATARGKLAFLRDPGIERILKGGGREISFADLKRKKMTVYLIIPPDLLDTHGRFLRLLVMSALGELFKERTAPPYPVLFMLDEFAQLGRMELIENVASVGRDYKIRLWPILQNIPQLKALYGNKWESFLSAAGVVQFFTPADIETARYISSRSGLRTIRKKTESHSSGTSTGGQGSTSTGTSTSYAEVEEPYYKPDEILGMANDKQLLLVPNSSRCLEACRVPYFRDSLWHSWPDLVQDPYHMTADELLEFEAIVGGGYSFFSEPVVEHLWEVYSAGCYAIADDIEIQKSQIVGKTPCGLMALDPDVSQTTMNEETERLRAARNAQGRGLKF